MISRKKNVLFSTVLSVFFTVVCSWTKTDLTGNDWIVTNQNKTIRVNATVPGSSHIALMDAGHIHDPYYRDGDIKYRWIAMDNWIFRKTFKLHKDVTNADQVVLVFEGLDTIGTVQFNGHDLGDVDNMFVTHTFDITHLVKTGENILKVKFQSAVKAAAERANKSAYVIPPECHKDFLHGECHVNMIRKEQCSFSWNFGVSFPTQAIWRPVYIESFNSPILSQVSAITRKVNSQWEIEGKAHFRQTARHIIGTLFGRLEKFNLTFSQNVSLTANETCVPFKLQVPKNTHVPLWWPNGYGDRPMFKLNVSFTSKHELSSKTIKLAFRTVDLIQKPVSNNASQGLSFYFEINGLPVFLKGSNWVPLDSFQERITLDKLRFIMKSTAEVGINAVRVWGGGIYESDEFYSLADELGIMIWQDFMFSVALYPSTPQFLQSVGAEVEQQVLRIKHHPSIIVWAGNNENEKAISYNWFHKKPLKRYRKDYLKLYVDTIKPIVEREDPTREYLMSSPTNGKETTQSGYVSKDPGSLLYGDIHWYKSSVDQWDGTVFEIPRMCTEYGLPGYPLMKTLRQSMKNTDFGMNTYMIRHRQRNRDGNKRLKKEIMMHLNLSNAATDRERFIDFMYLTQINQAMTIRTQTEHYRRYQSRVLDDGRGLTMGAMYWMLTDIWQSPTWASLDYRGEWKMVHYHAKTFFSPNLVSPYIENDQLNIYMVLDQIPTFHHRDTLTGKLQFKPMKHIWSSVKSELSRDETERMRKSVVNSVSGVVQIDVYSFDRFVPIHTSNISYNLNQTAESIYLRPMADILTEAGCKQRKDCVLHFTARNKQGETTHKTWLPIASPKDSSLKFANVSIEQITELSSTEFEIELKTDAIAMFVWLETEWLPGHFSDNGFLMKEPKVKVVFYSRKATTVHDLKKQMEVKNFMDTK